jgi:hypothetical protein
MKAYPNKLLQSKSMFVMMGSLHNDVFFSAAMRPITNRIKFINMDSKFLGFQLYAIMAYLRLYSCTCLLGKLRYVSVMVACSMAEVGIV